MNFDKSVLQGFSGSIENQVIEALKRAGEDFITEARQYTKSQGGFGDVTGNLRNSIGYFILKDGKIVNQSKNKGGLVEQAVEYIKNLFSSTKGIKIICFAAMNYASFVESKGFNVISAQKEGFVIDLQSYLDAIAKSRSKSN